jgi:hypothetical protein
MGLLSRRAADPVVDVELTAVSTECEAFLAGTLETVKTRRGESPVWTWLNVIAHGELAEVVALAGDDGDGARSTTLRTVAAAVLADGRDLAVLQHEVLVPLELAHVGEVMTPRRLVEIVGCAIYGT